MPPPVTRARSRALTALAVAVSIAASVAAALLAAAAPVPAAPAATASGVSADAVAVRAVSAESVASVVVVPRQIQPPAPPPEPPVAAPTPSQVPERSCGVFDLAACISQAATGLLESVVTGMVNPAVDLLTGSLLLTPVPSQVPRLGELWSISWRLAVSLYGLLVLAGGLVVMAYQSVQTRYGVREVAPRLVVGFLAGWLTLPIADMAVQIANALAAAIVGEVVDERGGPAGLRDVVRATVADAGQDTFGGWVLLAAVVVIGLVLLAVLCGWVLRVVLTIALVAAAPLVVMWHALPQTDGIARWWWRALAALLAIQIVQAVVLAVGLQMILPPAGGGPAPMAGLIGAPGGDDGGQGASGRWVTLLVLGVLLWVLAKVPAWAWSQISVGGGRSMLGTAVRAAIVWKTGGLLRGALSAGGRTSARTSGGAGGAASRMGAAAAGVVRARFARPPRPHDPYDSASEHNGGQLSLPLTGLRRGRTRPRRATGETAHGPESARGAAGAAPRPGRGQLELPLEEGIWPEHRPRPGRDGQWRLPLDVTRAPRPRTQHPPTPAAAPRTPAGSAGAGGVGRAGSAPRQWAFPADGLWPEQRPRLGPGGQYRLAFPVTRTPRPARPTPPPPAPTVATFGGRQLSLDQWGRETDPFRGNRPLRAGQYPLPLHLPERPPRRRTERPPPPAPPAGRAAGQLRLPIPATPPPPPPRPASPPRSAAPQRPAPPARSVAPPGSKPAPRSPSAPPAGTRMPGLRRPRPAPPDQKPRQNPESGEQR